MASMEPTATVVGLNGSHRGVIVGSAGGVEQLPSGSLRGASTPDRPVSKKKQYLVETVPAGRSAARDTERVRTRLLN